LNRVIITVPAGQSSASYYLQSSGDNGVVSYTGSAPGYQSKTANVTLSPSGVVIAGPFGPGFPLIANAGGPSQPVSVTMAQLDPATDAVVAPQALAGGRTLSVALVSDSTATGTVTTPVTIAGGSDTGIGQFKPLTAGNTAIRVTQPTFYTMPATGTSLPVTVH
jgi:hypothetical protein